MRDKKNIVVTRYCALIPNSHPSLRMTGESAFTSEHSWRGLSQSYISALMPHSVFPGPFQWDHTVRIASFQLRKKGPVNFWKSCGTVTIKGKKRRESKVAKISGKASMKQEHWLVRHLLTFNAWL